MIYTTTQQIAKRLDNRLQLGGNALTFGYVVVDPDLITQIGGQVEARVNAKLRQIYSLPLTSNNHPELASIVEKMAVSELVNVYFSGSDSDSISNFGSLMLEQAQTELMAIASGDVQLVGETPIYAPKSIVPNRTRVLNRESTYTERHAAFNQELNYKKGDRIKQIESDSVRW